MTGDGLESDLTDGVLTLRLTRPDRLNALTAPLLDELTDTVRTAGGSARAILLTGTGRGFCSGVDLRYAAKHAGTDLLRDHFHPAVLSFVDAGIPIVTAINGVTAGAGLAFALLGDVRVSSDTARFVPAFAKLGLVPDAGTTHFARLRMGTGGALRFLLAPGEYDAESARAHGLVDDIVPNGSELAYAQTIAEGFARQPQRSTRRTVELVRGPTFRAELVDALEREASAQSELTGTARAD